MLSWNYSKNPFVKEPFSGVSYLEGADYNILEKRIMDLLVMNYEEYEKKLNNNNAYIVEKSEETFSKIQKKMFE